LAFVPLTKADGRCTRFTARLTVARPLHRCLAGIVICHLDQINRGFKGKSGKAEAANLGFRRIATNLLEGLPR
jgi:hypothetical protein